MKTYEFRQKQGRSGERYWKIGREENSIYTEWGAVAAGSDKNQHGSVTDTIEAKGKEGTAAWVSPVDNAIFEFKRKIRKKTEEGYRPVGKLPPEIALTAVTNAIDHMGNLPKNLCFSKPTKDPPRKYTGRTDLIYTRKMNGESVIVHKMENGEAKIYSRRMDDITDWFPHLEDFVSLNPAIPNKSILMFEGFMGGGNSRKDAILAASIFRSDPPLAIEKQIKGGWMKFYLFRIPVWNGKNVEEYTLHQNQLSWIASLEKECKFRTSLVNGPHGAERFLYSLEIVKGGSLDEMYLRAQKLHYEGWVAYVPDEKFGDKSFSFHGKADRPSSFFKVKPVQEDDFILKWNPANELGTYGTGKNRERVGSVSMFQYTKNGKLVYCGEVTGGLSDQKRQDITSYVSTAKKTWESVAEIHYDDRFFESAGDGSNKLQLPRIARFRPDKAAEECVCEDL